jgi:hypothetical protein
MNLITILIIISGMSSTSNDRLNLLVDTLFAQHEISFDVNQYDIYKKDHNPKWKGNYEGSGVYIYDKYTIHFTDIVGYNNEIFIDRISKKTFPNKIIFDNSSEDLNDLAHLIRCFGKGKIKIQENIDFEYYKKELHEYLTDKYKVIFVIENGKILSLVIQKK